MAYKHISNTTSGWVISEDPEADPDMRWRAVHERFGTRYFDARHKILEYTVKHLMRQFKQRTAQPGVKFTPWTSAICPHCGGQWLVPGNPDDPSVLEGVCMDCQADSDVEKPLMFTRLVTFTNQRPALPDLPKSWLVS